MLLDKKESVSKFSLKELERKLNNKGFSDDGILAVMDHLLKDKNPNGLKSPLSFCSSNIKGGLASLFNISGNKKITKTLVDSDKKYPEVKNFLKILMSK